MFGDAVNPGIFVHEKSGERMGFLSFLNDFKTNQYALRLAWRFSNFFDIRE